MSIALCSLVINEMEWLPALYTQHRDWPGLVSWICVESADRVYAETNPEMVNKRGLSVDGTTEYLKELEQKDRRVVYIPHGISNHINPAQGKCESRQRYLEALEVVKPDYLLILDADEFYTKRDQERISKLFPRADSSYNSFCIPYRHLWRPPSIVDRPIMESEVVKGFWAIEHCHGFRWFPGLRYGNYHMTPKEANGTPLSDKMLFLKTLAEYPQCVHLGFAAGRREREAKHRYYATRGEAADRKRNWYVASRKTWEIWRPGTVIPRGAEIIPYT